MIDLVVYLSCDIIVPRPNGMGHQSYLVYVYVFRSEDERPYGSP